MTGETAPALRCAPHGTWRHLMSRRNRATSDLFRSPDRPVTNMATLRRMETWLAVGTFATTAVTAAATAYAVLQRRWDRPRPEWQFSTSWRGFDGIGATDSHGDERDVVRCTLANVGDGPGYAVRVAGRGCQLYQHGDVAVGWPVVERGAPEKFALKFDEKVEGSAVVVTWHQPPRRGKTRRRLFSVDDTRPR